ncbi:uncharacterized protein LOC62_01G000218 [Vanrija pseudolonga]|uniref:Uncharacterized protein n=1 Tax=Vanrija pseudolonga TaxID=143232 RepID=A0AAF0Y004_9TREE|nr:hypothetical protein LOC62_01G000218 [Vanrija pseudolonga]
MSDKEQQFTTQPHPATTNNPADLVAGKTPGLVSDAAQAFNTPGIQQIGSQAAAALEQPKTREQLQEEFKKLNQ